MSSFEDMRVVSGMVSYAVNALWQAPLIGAAAWAVSRMLRRVGPRAQHVAWVGALLLMVVLPAMPRWHWQMHPARATAMMVVDDFDLSTLPPMTPVEQPWWSAQQGLATLPRGLVLAMLLGYLSAGLYFAVRLGWSLWRTRMLMREAVLAEFAPEAEAVWERCRAAFGLGEVRRLVSSEIACPVTMGRATLLVPEGFVEGASAEELLTALAHECAHLQRQDFAKNVMYEMASVLVAFHPATWLVKRQIAETREMVCDGTAVERVVDTHSYVRSLLRLAEGVVGMDSMGSQAAMGMFDGRTLERRIVMMKTRRRQMGWMARCGLMTVAGTLLAAVTIGGASLAVVVEAKAAPVTELPVPAPIAVTQNASANGQQALPVQMEDVTAQDLQHPDSQHQDSQHQQAEAAQAVAAGDASAATMSDAERMRKLDELHQQLKELVEAVQKSANTVKLSDADLQRVKELNAQTRELMLSTAQRQQVVAEKLRAAQQQIELYKVSPEQQAKMTALWAAMQEQLKSLKLNQQALAQIKNFKLGQLAPLQAIAPTSSSSLSGVVSDQTGAVIPGATVTAKSLSTGAVSSVRTDPTGSYAMHSLAAGRYEMTVQAPGFALWSVSAMTLEPNNNARIDARLQVGRVAMQTVVTGVPQAGAATAPEPEKPRGPQRVSGGVIAGMKVAGDEPVYPPIARAAHVQGQVVLQAIIGKDGSVQKASALSGPNMLQSSAMAAVGTWKFKPYLLNGEPVEVETTITVSFVLPPDGQGANVSVPMGPQRISGGVMAGNKIGGDELKYPAEAKAAHVQGAVVLHAVISKVGRVEQLEVVSGPELLQNAAMESVRTWQYKPYILNGQPTEVDTTVTVVFSMNGEQGRLTPASFVQNDIRRVGGGVSAPVVIRSTEPEFTERAREAKFSGNVMVYLVVDAHGRPQRVHILKPVGLGLDEKAVESVKQYRFKPAMENGKPVPVELSMEVDFKIF